MSVAKIDIDVKPLDYILEQWIETRKDIIKKCGYTLVNYNVRETQHGYHVWFEIAENITSIELCVLQFLLGDDTKRVKFNFLRLRAKVFHEFNALFSKKLKRKKVQP